MCVHALERMRRLFLPVLLAALFTYHIAENWPRQAVLWLRHLGGKLGHQLDADGPNVLLAGMSAVFITLKTLIFALHHPFPSHCMTFG